MPPQRSAQAAPYRRRVLLSAPGISTFANATVNGGVLYMESSNSYYISGASGTLYYSGYVVLHSGNWTSYISAVSSQYWSLVGDYQIPQDWAMHNPFGAHVVVSDISHISSYGGVTERCRQLWNVISGGHYVVGAVS